MTKEQIQEFTRRISQENHSGFILILCDMIHVYVEDALHAYDEEDAVKYIRQMELAKQSLNELIACFAPGHALSRRVINILRFIYGKFVKSVVKGKPDELDRCLGMIDNLRVGFVKIHEMDPEGPVMTNTHQVYAGLTYGRGTLNESIQGVDYKNRGYQA